MDRKGTVCSSVCIILILFAAVGCGTTVKHVELNPSPHAMIAKSPEQVEVFTSTKPERAFVEVSMIEAQQSSAFSTDTLPDIIRGLRAKAAMMGCDGIIITSSSDQVVGNQYGTATLKGYRATCIAYK